MTRLNEAKEKIKINNFKAKQLSDTYLVELKKQNAKEQKIQKIKNDKDTVRARILALQEKLKEKKG